MMHKEYRSQTREFIAKDAYRLCIDSTCTGFGRRVYPQDWQDSNVEEETRTHAINGLTVQISWIMLPLHSGKGNKKSIVGTAVKQLQLRYTRQFRRLSRRKIWVRAVVVLALAVIALASWWLFEKTRSLN
jgi:hypothetical protein